MNDRIFALGLSGLQDFVYDVQAEDAARRLRIRSAILTIAPAIVALRLARLSQEPIEPYYLGGGQLLSPCSMHAIDSIRNELLQLEEWLLLHSAGRVGLYWTSIPTTSDTKADLQAAIAAATKAKWQSGRHDGQWLTFASRLTALDEYLGTLGDPDWEADAGRELVRAGGFSGFRLLETGDGWPIGPWKVRPVSDAAGDIEIQTKEKDTGISVSLPTHVATYETGEIVPFDEIARRGKGAPYLAALKLDADNLGKSMSEALAEGVDCYKERSEAIKAFFAVTVPELFQSSFPNVYLIYSGGDDLAAVGHFYDIVRVAHRIHVEYRKQSLGTLSAGIAAFHRKSPVRMVMDLANSLLEDHAKKERNSVCVFGQTLTWDNLAEVIKEAEILVQAVETQPNSLPRGMLQLLRQLHALYSSDIPVLQRVRFRALPLIQYLRQRRLEKIQLSQDTQQLIVRLEGGYDPAWERIGLVAMLAAWLTRSQENEK